MTVKSFLQAHLPTEDSTTLPNTNLRHEYDEETLPSYSGKYARIMGHNELSYYLPSRADGANDMICYFKFDCGLEIVTSRRIHLAWAILRVRHPPFASSVRMDPGCYDQARFEYIPPSNPNAALSEARASLEISFDKTGKELADEFVNGPRILSDQRLCCLIVSLPPYAYALRSVHGFESSHKNRITCEMLIGFAHFTVDGTAAHQFTNELLSLLGGPSASNHSRPRSEEELRRLLEDEWNMRWGQRGARSRPDGFKPIPKPAEERMHTPANRFRLAAEKIAFQNFQNKELGGHLFPRIKPTSRRRHNKITTMAVPEHLSQIIVAKCKAHGVTVSNAIFVLCSFAWIRLVSSRISSPLTPATEKRLWKQIGNEMLPIMVYTAVNLRPYMDANPPPPESYVYLTLGYLNVILPGFLPRFAGKVMSEEEKKRALQAIFWLRARSVREQSRKALASPFFASRNRIMGQERAARAKAWAVVDDRAEEDKRRAVAGLPPLPPLKPSSTLAPASKPSVTPKPPSAALIGISIWPSIDSIYDPSNFPAINLLQLVSQTRKNTGGMLIMGFTLRGKINVSFGWDANCFPEGVIEEFWKEFEGGIREFLVGESEDFWLERGLEVGTGSMVGARL
ncbi:uncharacterized protein EI90DRAFT_3127342 [Cantharellus anzutake]|uniref:uncharacterized protein n=1 Tax=Cantharellus anzutake TaxID=1750568 RepID=UPI001904B79F|nr:uncharacterized protein EI90DRAFT_3127342 [Cantharellus anzutake]KAF8327292.1 hypothetical protein EI90DRAFT_3127342 [Cantharellus anzutake]